MSKKLHPTDALKQAQDILIAWEHIDPNLRLGPLTYEGVAAELEAVKRLKARMIELEIELIHLRNQRDAASLSVWDKVKRVRASIKGIYGDDSTEYEIAGGTRRSERKKPRKAPLPEPVGEPAEEVVS